MRRHDLVSNFDACQILTVHFYANAERLRYLFPLAADTLSMAFFAAAYSPALKS